MKPERTAVAVVGGGPAGSACALTLARSGVDVCVIERAEFPRAKACGEYLNAGAVQLLDRLGAGALVRARGAAVQSLTIRDRTGTALELPFCGESLSLARRELDALLLGLAQAAGAQVVRGRAEDLGFDACGRVRGISYRDMAGDRAGLEARIVVGADGARSVVAKALGVAKTFGGPERFAVGGHFEGVALRAGALEMNVEGSSYLASNPLGGGLHNVMLVVPRAELNAARNDVDAYFAARSRELGGAAFEGARREGQRMGFGPLASAVRRPYGPGALLAGDAAGMIDPFTGQGVFLALRSGVEAAQAILGALARPLQEERIFAGYGRRHARDLELRRTVCRIVKSIVGNPPLARRAALRLSRSPARAQAVFAPLSGLTRIEYALDPRALAALVA